VFEPVPLHGTNAPHLAQKIKSHLTRDGFIILAWLPEEGGSIVRYPYLLAKSERQCWKCRKDTPLIGLCAKNYFTTAFNGPINIKWEKRELPVFFVDIWSIDNDLTPVFVERAFSFSSANVF
jgi:hypothetical protein